MARTEHRWIRVFVFLTVPVICVNIGFVSRMGWVEAASESSFIDYEKILETVDLASIREWVMAFSGMGSRVTGYVGCDEAASFIFTKLVEYGLQNVTYEYYDVAVPYDYGANITLLETGEVIQAFTLWPNSVETCAIPPEGIEGPLVHAGDGDPEDYEDRIEGSVVLMDFDSRDRWIFAAEYGAKAIVFIEKETTKVNAGMKTVGIPLEIPRLYLKREDGYRLLNLMAKNETVRVNVRSTMVYEKRKGTNVLGFLPGTDPELSSEVVVVAAHYDSYSIVPSVAPGAEEACGVATLLELANYFSQNPPRRTIVFVAFAGHNQALIGAREFVYRYFNDVGSRLKLLVNLDLNTKSDTLGAFYWGSFYGHWECIGRFDVVKNALFGRYLPEIERQLSRSFRVENLFIRDQDEINKYVPESFLLDSEPFALAGGIGFSFQTTHALRVFQGTPFDTPEKMTFENLQHQLNAVSMLVSSLVMDQQLQLPRLTPLTSDISLGGFAILNGRVWEFNFTTAWYQSVPDALVVVTAPYINSRYTLVADENGFFEIHGVPHRFSIIATNMFHVMAFKDDPTFGPIEYAPNFGKHGLSVYRFINLEIDQSIKTVNTVVFKAGNIVLLGIKDPTRLGLGGTIGIEVREFEKDLLPDFFGLSEAGFNAIVHVEADTDIEIILRPVEPEPIGVIVNASSNYPQGCGFKVPIGKQVIVGSYQIAKDFYWINEARSQISQSYDVLSNKAVDCHNQTLYHIGKALASIEQQMPDYAVSYKETLEAWSLGRLAFLEIKELMRDTINTCIFFFILLLPFTVLAERLLVEARDIIRRLAFLALIFSLFAFMLYFLHPGFHIASNISMAILGFILTVLISPGLLLVSFGLRKVLLEVRESLLGAHFSEDISSAIFVSAFSVGIQNLKKRKLRTILNLISITLIVFSLVSFTSLSTASTVAPTMFEGKTSYHGLFVRNPRASVPVTQDLIDYFGSYSEDALVAKRAFLYPTGAVIAFQGPNGSIFEAEAAVGLTTAEPEVSGLDISLIDGRWFVGDSRFVCIIPHKAATILDVGVGDEIVYGGLSLAVDGIFDTALYSSIVDLDQIVISPMIESGPEGGGRSSISAESIVILPYDLVLDLGFAPQAAAYTLAVSLKNGSAAFDVGEMLARAFPGLNIYAGFENAIVSYYKAGELVLSGWQMLIVPFVIASLCMFNLMLGSVYERTKEISTYAVLGLSPRHVSIMFLAEASIYSILGGVIGYVMGLFVSKVLTTFTYLPLEFIPKVSSSWVILAVGISMASIFLSTLFPMYKSAKMVTPSLERKWKIPTKPRGNEWEVPLPFKVDKDEIDGVIAYIEEFMRAHTTERAGTFWMRAMQYIQDESEDALVKSLKTTIRMMPYEAGIEQKCDISFVSKKRQREYDVVLVMTRITGVWSIWRNSNRKYIDVIRKQLLLWGSLSQRDKDRYLG